MKLQKNTVLITGGSSGLGLEMARKWLAQDNRVLICGRSKVKLDKARQELPGLITFQADISKAEDCIRLAEWVETNYPECNVLVNNAALAHSFQFTEEKEALDKAQLEIQTNLLAPIHLTKLFLPIIEKQDHAHLINITTGLVYIPRAIYPFYSGTKAALHSFTQVLRLQMSGKSVKVVEVMFPAVDTPWHKGNAPKIAISPEQAVKEMLSGLSKGKETIRVGKVKLLYLISRLAPRFALKKINALK